MQARALMDGAAWAQRIAIPLRDAPDSPPWGWIVRGWIVENGQARPLDTRGMVETEYEALSFIVDQLRDDGWIRFRYAGPEGRAGGLAWVHRDELALGDERLDVERWEDRFLSGEISPLFERDRGTVPWLLYTAPADDAAIAATIRGDHEIEPLEVTGEWLRVRVRQPPQYCMWDDPDAPVIEGWIRWWTERRGPEVWYYTRGC